MIPGQVVDVTPECFDERGRRRPDAIVTRVSQAWADNESGELLDGLS